MLINYALTCVAVVLTGLAVVLAVNLYADWRDGRLPE